MGQHILKITTPSWNSSSIAITVTEFLITNAGEDLVKIAITPMGKHYFIEAMYNQKKNSKTLQTALNKELASENYGQVEVENITPK